MGMYLTKTKYNSALRCSKKLWIEHHEKIDPVYSAFSLLNMTRGREVDAKARELFPDAFVLCSINPEQAYEETMKALNGTATVIAQPTFIYNQLLVRPDIMEKQPQGWHLIEVKMTASLDEKDLPEVCYQKYVAEQSGITICKCSLLYLNKDCLYPNLSNLFTISDVTDRVAELEESCLSNIAESLVVLKGEIEPTIRNGRHCTRDPVCHFKEYCWKDVPYQSIFTIPMVSQINLDKLLDINILEVIDVPDDFKLPEKQSRYVELIKSGVPRISRNTIKSSLENIIYPVYFLDFEADLPPIPQFDGMRPFNLLPFQYSLHVMNEVGNLSHFKYLHETKSDPRKIIANLLMNQIGERGSIVVYDKKFETRVIKELAAVMPEQADTLLSWIERLWDQRNIFTADYQHPDFEGKTSLKSVLPVLIPGLSYDDLEVNNGNVAVANWVKMIGMPDDQDKNDLKEKLLKYCNLDTLAMVEIHNHLKMISTI